MYIQFVGDWLAANWQSLPVPYLKVLVALQVLIPGTSTGTRP